jgi:heterogeneous nuclear ribonucleoprotein U-like protein 1
MAAADVEMKTPEAEADAEMKPAEEKPEEPKAPEPPKEHEEDAKALSGEKVKGADFLVSDTTLNVMRSDHGNGSLLMSLQDHGLQFLMAGARASVGIKSGRYMFEVRIVECASPSDSWYPKHLLKIGFSTKDSSLLLDQEDGMSAYFDSEGHFGEKSKQSKLSQKCWQTSVVSCLLNLEKGHENCNTISVFRDGKRISEPQPLPESLHGKTLFPTVNFKCMTLQTNFGPEPMCDLPFKCHTVGGAAKKDAEVSTHTPPSSRR